LPLFALISLLLSILLPMDMFTEIKRYFNKK
jgi:hypothetical protein